MVPLQLCCSVRDWQQPVPCSPAAEPDVAPAAPMGMEREEGPAQKGRDKAVGGGGHADGDHFHFPALVSHADPLLGHPSF